LVHTTSINKTLRILVFHHLQIARNARPGQFVQILTSIGLEPFLPRPMSVFSTQPREGTFAILCAVIGPATERLARLAIGDELPIIGPLGNVFTFPRNCEHAVLVAGGVGLPPLDFWARRLNTIKRKNPPEITLLIGARSNTERPRIAKINGVRRWWSTDDGSFGFHGNVVQLLQHLHTENRWPIEKTVIYGCGPRPMLQALQKWIIENDYPGQLSLEEMMACGFGVCSGCAVPVRPAREGYEKYKRVCYDGPVFDAREVFL